MKQNKNKNDLQTETGSIQTDIVTNRENRPEPDFAVDTRVSGGGVANGADFTSPIEERAHSRAIEKASGERSEQKEDKLPSDPIDPEF